MAACWCRLTQPEKSRRKKPSGGDSGSMAEACPKGRPGSRGASLEYRRLADRAEVPEAQASSKASTRLLFGDPSSAEFSHLSPSQSARAVHGATSARPRG